MPHASHEPARRDEVQALLTQTLASPMWRPVPALLHIRGHGEDVRETTCTPWTFSMSPCLRGGCIPPAYAEWFPQRSGFNARPATDAFGSPTRTSCPAVPTSRHLRAACGGEAALSC